MDAFGLILMAALELTKFVTIDFHYFFKNKQQSINVVKLFICGTLVSGPSKAAHYTFDKFYPLWFFRILLSQT